MKTYCLRLCFCLLLLTVAVSAHASSDKLGYILLTEANYYVDPEAPANPYRTYTNQDNWELSVDRSRVETPEAGLTQPIGLIVANVGLFVVFLYYLIVWFSVGRDPAPLPVTPLFSPPSGLSPIALSYIENMSYDNKMFSAAIINMAVKGYIIVIKCADDAFAIRKTVDAMPDLSLGEQYFAEVLFSQGNVLKLIRKNRRLIKDACIELKRGLKFEYDGIYFSNNSILVIFAAILSVVSLAPLVSNLSLFYSITYFFIALVPAYIAHRFFKLYLKFRNGIYETKPLLLVSFTLLLITFCSFLIHYLNWRVLESPIVIFFLFLFINDLFSYLLKCPTTRGLKITSEARGFALFLKTADIERIKFNNPAKDTLDFYETNLPYAIALGVERSWSNKCSKLLKKFNYQPIWYQETNVTVNPIKIIGNITDSLLESFSEALTA